MCVDMADSKGLEEDILATFSELASTLGYSPIHGKIIGALLVEGGPLSLQELAKRTKYSSGMISNASRQGLVPTLPDRRNIIG